MVKMVAEFKREPHDKTANWNGKIAAAGRGRPTALQVRLDLGRQTIKTWEQVVEAMDDGYQADGGIKVARDKTWEKYEARSWTPA
jgi:hypothetical protein